MGIEAIVNFFKNTKGGNMADAVAVPVTSAYNDFEGHDAAEQYVVLMKDPNSKKFCPVFHTKNLRNKPIQQMVNGVAQGPEIWNNDAGAVDYINYHSAAAAWGTLYQIKNRKGEIA
jgi:hypothetical protein